MYPIYPDLSFLQNQANTKDYTHYPLTLELLADIKTPLEVLKLFKEQNKPCFLLESVISKEQWGRYTFLGFDPVLEITGLDGQIYENGQAIKSTTPQKYLRKLLAQYRVPKLTNLPPFIGGLVGYFGYDYFKYAETKLKLDAKNPEALNDFNLMLFTKVVCFDHSQQKIYLIANMPLTDLTTQYQNICQELQDLAQLLNNQHAKRKFTGELLAPLQPRFTKERFSQMIQKAKNYIYEGDIFQVVLSNCLSAPFQGSLLDTYRQLRLLNPSPYLFYVQTSDLEVIGASPETLVKLENETLYTYPLAGTRPRGKTLQEDLALENELLQDEKELAEHNMLVDLGRNDLGKVCQFGTVEVEKYLNIERFSHVMHIGSTIRGIIQNDKDALNTVDAILPAGTLSGAPKFRACEIINELEDVKRGIYGGAIGYIDFSGNLDLCIAIRIIYQKNQKIFIQSGAGIVADSNADKEYQECINKAKATVKALELAGGNQNDITH